jgi:hypothetical protein
MNQASMLFNALVMIAGIGWYWLYTNMPAPAETAPTEQTAAAPVPADAAKYFVARAPIPGEAD